MVGYSYDASGDLLSDGQNTYTYDAEGHILTVNGSTSYVYDAEGRRVESNYGSYQMDYIYNLDGKPLEFWYYNPNAFIWFFEHNNYLGDQLLETSGDSQSYFFMADHLGSARIGSDYQGNPYESIDYLPFGELANNGESPWPNFVFTGQEFDSESGLSHFPARYLATNQGRWTSPDPLAGDISNPQSLNRYTYASNSPLSYVDPSGLSDAYASNGGVCTYDAYYGVDQCGISSMCEANSGSSCDESGGSIGLSINLNLNMLPNDLPLNEANGLPPGLSVPPVTLQSVLFGGDQCEFGPCFGNAWLDGSSVGSWVSTIGSFFCRAGFIGLGGSIGGAIGTMASPVGAAAGAEGGVFGAGAGGGAVILAGTVAGGYVGYKAGSSLCPGAPLMSKGGTQEVGHDYVREKAREMGGDYCTNLKAIMDQARKAKNSKLFNDAKATWKADCRKND